MSEILTEQGFCSAKIVVLVSGGGTNLQAIIDAQMAGELNGGEIALVVSSRPDAYALKRAERAGIPTRIISRADFPVQSDMSTALLDSLAEADTDLIVLAGYMSILAPEIISAYPGRIINIHPSLIPRHCGRGYYGLRVHESVIAAGDSESGATVHFVDNGVDTGDIIIQERVGVKADDTAETLASRVLEVEHKILVLAVNKVLQDAETRRQE